jgi:hypothetical protein
LPGLTAGQGRQKSPHNNRYATELTPTTQKIRPEDLRKALAKADDPVISGARDLRIKVVPIRSSLRSILSSTRDSTFKAFFSADCCFNIVMWLKIDEAMDAISFGKTLDQVIPMLVNPAHKIVGNSDVHSAAYCAGENVDPVITLGAHIQAAVFTGSSAFADDDNYSK